MNHETAKSTSGKTIRLTSDDFSSDRKQGEFNRGRRDAKGLAVDLRAIRVFKKLSRCENWSVNDGVNGHVEFVFVVIIIYSCQFRWFAEIRGDVS